MRTNYTIRVVEILLGSCCDVVEGAVVEGSTRFFFRKGEPEEANMDINKLLLLVVFTTNCGCFLDADTPLSLSLAFLLWI